MENDLENMKKTMPYTVPDGFFDMMEERLKQETVEKKEKSNLRKAALWTGFAVAASLALLLVVRQMIPKSDENSFEQVETAFNQLSETDQELIFDYYDEIEYFGNY
ncbi:MAG: hypothetical protein IJK78_00340 [Bacteroidales bacterium]|nr:hypothetical protein [Bacteroidales bacterium]